MTEKPLALMREVVKICERGGLVLDPFGGSGSTAHAALLEGRSAITVELAPFWVEHIRRRVDFEAPTVESGTQTQLGLGGPEGDPRG